MTVKIALQLAIAALALSTIAPAQAPLFPGARRPASTPSAVEYLYPEQLSLAAGKPATVVLHFRVAPGLHINSHKPHEEFLIPTVFSIPEASGVRLEAATYQVGTDYTSPLDPSAKLNVYSGEFTIQVRLVATAGDHLVEAKLRYQACDNNACMPPKTIPVAIDVIGK
jgi:hypothetical protein